MTPTAPAQQSGEVNRRHRTTAGIVLASVVMFTVVAILTLTSIHSIAHGHDTVSRISERRAVVTWSDSLMRGLIAADREIERQVKAGAVSTKRIEGMLAPIAPATLTTLRDAASHQDSFPVPVASLIDAAQAQQAIFRRVLFLSVQGERDQALALLDGAEAATALARTEAASDAVSAAVAASRTNWAEQEQQAGETNFWIILLTGGVGLLGVLAGTALLLRSVETWSTLDGNLVRAQSALARSEQTRNSFLQVVGHDLRQPLQAIGLFAAGLERRITESNSRQLLDGLSSAAASMNRMLSGLMEISRLDAGAMKVELAVVSLDSVLDPIRGEFAAIAQAKGIALLIPPSPLVVYTDPTMLESILRNLVSNAVRYTQSGGVELMCEAHHDQIAITVSDTGLGIPEADLEAVFQDFFRVTGNDRPREGLGLGLGIVRRMSGLLEVPISVSSTVDKGTKFSLTLPLVANAAAELAAPTKTASLATMAPELFLAGKHVLLVDDDEAVRQGLNSELSARGMLVTTSASSTQTCALFERQGAADDGSEFDMVLMDRDLQSEMSGTELLDHLAARYGVMLPALIISGTADFRVVLDLQESGYPWLAKPVSMPVLLREMQRVIQHERPDVSLRG